MRSHILFGTIVGALYTGIFLTCTAVHAQSYEDQARTIMQLFQSGQKDTAYVLLEPLKKSARFVPAVLYTRAQMTPDDRALALYKEVIALNPKGPWADQATFQLVSRYVEKGDSVAAQVWAEVLKSNHSGSPLVASATDMLKGVQHWQSMEDDPAVDISKGKPSARESVKEGTSGKESQKKAEEKKGEEKKVAEKKSEGRKAEEKKEPAKLAEAKSGDSKAAVPSDTYKASGMKGYALQVGVFSTRDLADSRSQELKRKNIRSVALPKMVNGKKQYALVVGPYTSIEEANKKKPTVAGACNCEAFVVKVQ